MRTDDSMTTRRLLVAAILIAGSSLMLAACGGGGSGVVVRGPYQRGNALYEEGDLDGAIEQFRIALDSTPDDYRIRYNLGLAYHDKARIAGPDDEVRYQGLAESSYREVLKRSPGNARAISALAVLIQERDGLDAAIAYLEKAAPQESKETRGLAQWTLGSLYRSAGRTEDARRTWMGALALDPTHRDVRTALADCLACDGECDLDAAELVIEEGLATHKYDFGYRLLHARIALERARGKPYEGDGAKAWDEALRRFRKAEAMLPRHFAVAWGMGLIQETRGELEKAIAAYWVAREAASPIVLERHGLDEAEFRTDVDARLKSLHARLAAR